MRSLVLLGLGLTLSTVHAAEHRVSSAADVSRVARDARPGDVVILANGEWRDQSIVFHAIGTMEQPILVRAETPGEVRLTGESSVVIDGAYVTVNGIWLDGARGDGDGVRLAGRHCRLTQSAVTDSDFQFYVRLFGTENRVDHCYLAGKTNVNATLQIETAGEPNFHLIDQNHFGHRPPLGENNGATVQIGSSEHSMNASGSTVEYNLFDRCDGEIEIISNKSGENVYRFNTFLKCAGMLTLRQGDGCLVADNIFIGLRKQGAGGVQVIGANHTVTNNYIEGVTEGAFWLAAGIPDSTLHGDFQARNCRIANNTVLDSIGPCVELSKGLGDGGRTLIPENILLADNLFVVPRGGKLLDGTEGTGFHWSGNVASLPRGHDEVARDGLRILNVRLEQREDGLQYPNDASAPGFRRPGRIRPLTPEDVGPAWMDRDDS